jgi:transposase
MLTFPSALRIFLGVEPIDMRKQFNGLWALAQEKLKEDPRSGAVFVFSNKGRDRVKLLYFDGYVTVANMGQRELLACIHGGESVLERGICVAY